MKKITKVLTTVMFATSALAFNACASDDVLGKAKVTVSSVKEKPVLFATGEVVKFYTAKKEARKPADFAGLKATEQNELLTVNSAQLADMVANLQDDLSTLQRRKAKIVHDTAAYEFLTTKYDEFAKEGKVGRLTTYASLGLGKLLAAHLDESDLKVKLDGKSTKGVMIAKPGKSDAQLNAGIVANPLDGIKLVEPKTPTVKESAKKYLALKAQLVSLKAEVKELSAKEDVAYAKAQPMLSSIQLHEFYADQYKKPTPVIEAKVEVPAAPTTDIADDKGKQEETK